MTSLSLVLGFTLIHLSVEKHIYIGVRCKERRKASESILRKTDPMNINIFMTKLRLKKFTKEEARQFLPILEKELKQAREGDKQEYEKVVIGLTEILKMYLADAIDLQKPDFDVLKELATMKL